MDNSIKQVKAQQIAVDGNMQEMEVGTKILFDVLQAQTKLLEAKLNQISTIQKYYENLYQMLSLQGKLTAEGLNLPVEIFRIEQNYENIKNHI
jgi:outer membrane protein